jgi:hypothetical protein
MSDEKLELERWKPLFEAQIRFADITVRSLLILNGGAALALFTMAGNADKLGIKEKFPDLSYMALCFGMGAALGVLTAGLAYLTQLMFVELTPEERAARWGTWFRVLAVLCAILSWSAFVYGLWHSRYLFQ